MGIAAFDMDYGIAYYFLGKILWEEDSMQAREYLDRAKKLGVNVSSSYYADERASVSDLAISGGISGADFGGVCEGVSTVQSIVAMVDDTWTDMEENRTSRLRSVNERKEAQRAEQIAALSYEDALKGQKDLNERREQHRKVRKKVTGKVYRAFGEA